MLRNKMKKIIAFILSSFMVITVLGTTMAEAHPMYNSHPSARHEERRHNPPSHKDNDKGHSTGEVTTAAIIGAVLGAVVAKNT
ncbi:hypothetical protein NXG61_12105 [Pectinatus haikarae]|uniref:Uncharacterized protein n=2 Tax=Pectinatus haikarae TaxID=349096 RepID=A0ABT9Y4P6_9FIRM|nr:hypothetical protein [Pectinatus haikarae]